MFPETSALKRKRRPQPRSRFFSLRWKLPLILSLALIAVNASLALVAYRYSLSQFELQQTELRKQQQRQLSALIEDGFSNLSQLASLIVQLAPQRNAPDWPLRLNRELNESGALLTMEWGIQSVQLYTHAGAPLVRWPGDTRIPDRLLARLQQSADPDLPKQALTCAPDCSLYLAAPVLINGGNNAYLVLERSLADPLLTFQRLTDADVAVLVVTGDETGSDLQLPELARSIRAITHAQSSLALLHQAARTQAGALLAYEPVLIESASSWYEVQRLQPLHAGVDALIINRVTEQQASIRRAAINAGLIGLLGLLLSGSLLLAMMRGPVRRLTRVARLLPLLGDGRFGELRGALPTRGQEVRGRDEIDLVVDALGNVSEHMQQLAQAREQAEARTSWLDQHDPLTGLDNRRHFVDDFAHLIDQAVQFHRSGALLLIDLDQFKDINDLAGHSVGDELLRRVADCLRGLCEPSHLLARLGGDEFATALPRASAATAAAHAERIIQAIRNIEQRTGTRSARSSASIGIALFPEHGGDAQALLANADLAMYRAKDLGRGRWHLFAPSEQQRESLGTHVAWTERIDDALAEDAFELHFQPIVRIEGAGPAYFEALLRMRESDGQLLSPAHFISVAERTGRIRAIDQWVLKRVCEALATHPQVRLSMNLSAGDLGDATLRPVIERLLSTAAIAPKRLTFEITETAALSNVNDTITLMREIRALGCRFALDDFGSGFASYAYLRQLPVDLVKIDGSFVRRLDQEREDRLFVKAITDVAHGMGKKVVAEFVENQAILDILRELGVDYAQGYHLGRPSADAL